MSGPKEALEEYHASDIEAQAAIWLQRHHFWDWSLSDQESLDSWLAESTAHEVAYLRLKAGYGRTERLVALRAPRMENRARSRLLQIAAVVTGVATITVAATFYLSRPQEVTYTTPVGGHQNIALADGSQIELNTDTVLRVSVDAGHRTATLDRGEAYFQIRHHAVHPFVVIAAGHRVTDLGTKFVVRGDAARLEVTLVEGRARIDSENDFNRSHSAVLSPGDDVVATAQSMSVTRKTPQEQITQLSWRSGSIVFHHTALADAAEEFNRYNQNKIIVEGSVASKIKVDGTLPTNDPEAFADIAQDILHLRVEKRGDDFVISR